MEIDELISSSVRSGYGPQLWIKVTQSEDQKELTRLSRHSDQYIRCLVMQNENLGEKIINKLSNDGTIMVRMAVAAQPKIPDNIKIKLSKDLSWEVRRQIIVRKDLDLDLILNMYINEEEDLNKALLRRKIDSMDINSEEDKIKVMEKLEELI